MHRFTHIFHTIVFVRGRQGCFGVLSTKKLQGFCHCQQREAI